MKTDTPELLFATRGDFRAWLRKNAETHDGVWLVFGKTKAVATLSANDALEEALCFGWIDGQMKSVDADRYLKYFAKRRAKSVWSIKNKKTVEMLRAKKWMTPLGEKAVETAKQNGMWDARTEDADKALVDALAEKLSAFPSAHEHFMKLPPSAKLANTRRWLSVKNEAARQKTFEKIVEQLQ
ncbi:MAG: YdeI/OmpD-associated family protein [Kiritimatiellaeota bacterium]|nr:YdeI/OmpD-associated family protein [Kiritimatiellota bacterium]